MRGCSSAIHRLHRLRRQKRERKEVLVFGLGTLDFGLWPLDFGLGLWTGGYQRLITRPRPKAKGQKANTCFLSLFCLCNLRNLRMISVHGCVPVGVCAPAVDFRRRSCNSTNKTANCGEIPPFFVSLSNTGKPRASPKLLKASAAAVERVGSRLIVASSRVSEIAAKERGSSFPTSPRTLTAAARTCVLFPFPTYLRARSAARLSLKAASPFKPETRIVSFQEGKSSSFTSAS